MRNWWGLLAAMAGAIVLAIVATTPPAPKAANAPVTAFSASRAMADIRVIGRAPHPTGSAGDALVRAHLIGRLRAMGLQATTIAAPMSAAAAKRLAEWRGSTAPPPPLANILAILPGRDRSLPAVLLMAHHDSVWGSPAAADDSAGVAAALETIRAVKAGGQPRRDLMLLLTDGEELGLEGAKAFFGSDPRRAHVGVIVNMETRGGGGRASMFETGDGNGAMMRLFAQAVHRPVATSLSVFVYQHLPNSTDYTVAKKRGVPGFNFAFIGRPWQYHSPLATPDVLDQGAVQDMGRQTLDLTRALLDAPELPGRAADRTFFDAFGIVLISYPAALGWLLLAGAGLCYGAAAWRRTRIATMLGGAAAMLALVGLAAGLLYVGNLISGADGKVNYYDRLAAIPRLEAQALLLCLSAAALIWALIGRRSGSTIGLAAGAALPLLAVGVAMQWAAPTAAYPVAVPLLLGGLAALIGRIAGARAGMISGIVAAMLGGGYMIAFGFQLLEAVGPNLPVVAALPLAITALLAVPLVPPVERGRAMAASALFATVAIGLALWVRLDAVAPSVAVYSSFK